MSLDPVVIAVTRPLTKAVAEELESQAFRIAGDQPIVIDLTAIPSFDTDGAAQLVQLQDSMGEHRLTIVGMRQAAARLTGVADVVGGTAAAGDWVVRRMRNLAVVQAQGDASTDELDAVLTNAVEENVAIVVVDLKEVSVTSAGFEAIAFASSAAAVRGQELLVVNVDVAAADRLRQMGLSATTYVAPSA